MRALAHVYLRHDPLVPERAWQAVHFSWASAGRRLSARELDRYGLIER